MKVNFLSLEKNMIPFNNAMEIISGKWKMNILYSLSQLGTMRYG